MRNSYDRREYMIAETSTWLTWMLDNDIPVPRIPRRRVSDGGFTELLNLPGARMAMNVWWIRTLDWMDRLQS